jgi:hypothetical protein
VGRRLSRYVLVVRVGSLRDQVLAYFGVSVLAGEAEHAVAVFVRLVDVERHPLVAVHVDGPVIGDVRGLKIVGE